MTRTILVLALACAALTANASLAQTPAPGNSNIPLSLEPGMPAADDPSLPSNGGGVIPDSIRRTYASANTPTGGQVAAAIPGAASVDLSATAAPISSVQAELNRLALSGTPNRAGGAVPAGEALTPTTAPASATVATELVASAPVPDTPANRARYGQPKSHAGKMTAARGN